MQATDLLRTLMLASASETDTDLLSWTLLTYDTSRPAVDSTGRPPLQSELRAHSLHTSQRDTRLRTEQAETLQTVVVTADRSEGHENQTIHQRKTRKPVCYQFAAWLILLALLAVALRWLWKRIRK